ncbi:MAG: hypothetical protein CSA11_03710 [Chloroflexi bacterium]|nr:MAG: hypothetical protein CSA11_03710 [Chloroflexota bacterium]
MTNHNPSSANNNAVRAHNMIRIDIIMIVGVLLMTLAFIYLALQEVGGPIYFLLGANASFIVVSVIGLWLSRRERHELASWLLIITIAVMFFIANLLVDGLSWLLSIPLIMATAAITGQTIPPKQATRAILMSVTVAIAIMLFDLLELVDNRAIIPYAPVVVAIISLPMIAAFVYLSVRNFRDYMLRTKMIIAFIAVGVVVTVSVSVVSVLTLRPSMTVQIGETLTVKADGLSRLVVSFFLDKTNQIIAISETDIIGDLLEVQNGSYRGSEADIRAELQALDEQWVAAADDDPLIQAVTTSDRTLNPLAYQLVEYQQTFPDHSEIFITDRYGATVAATRRLPNYYQADKEWWQAAWNDGNGAVYISQPEYDESSGLTVSLIAVPVFGGGEHEVIGVVRSTLVLSELGEIIHSVRFGESGRAILFNEAAEVVFEGDSPSGESVADLDIDLRRQFLAEEPYFLTATTAEGYESLFGYAPVANVSWTETHDTEAVIESSVDDLGLVAVIQQGAVEGFAPVTLMMRNVQLVTIGALLLAALGGLLMAQFLTRPILALAEAADIMASGNLDAPLPTAYKDEVGELTVSVGDMAAELRDTLADLEQRVADRTRALAASAEVSRRLSTILDEQELVATVVEQVQSAFNYYHVHIYLMNEDGDTLLMAGGTGEAGAQMLAQGHFIPRGKGLVGRAAETNMTVLVPDVSQEEGWLPNALLPYTKAEAAVPITVGGRTLGVLDVQHNMIDGLRQTDATLLEAVAGQVAIALQNARAYQKTQHEAEQEALVNVIRRQLDQADTVEGVLQVAVRELGRALGAEETRIRLQTESGSENGRHGSAVQS